MLYFDPFWDFATWKRGCFWNLNEIFEGNVDRNNCKVRKQKDPNINNVKKIAHYALA